jgi:hypothetical protein
MFSHRRTSSILLICLLVSGLTFAKPKAAADRPVDPSIPPSDAQFTLYCQAVAGPAHVEQANIAKESLLKMTGMKDWYIVHQEGQSIIYYGFYRSIDDPKDKDTARAQADRKKIDALKDAAGNKVFDRPLFVQIDSPDPAAPQEWNLLNSKGYWSLQIGAYKDSPQRKQMAVEAVRDARKRGIEAYYYHGETTSSVCIGAWPRDAVREQEDAAAQAQDPGQDILVLPQALPAGANVQIRNRDGAPVKAVAPKFDILDPSMSAAKEQYPTHALNGEVHTKVVDDPNTGKKAEVEDPSFFVVVPHKAPSLLRQEPAPPQLVGPATPQTPGAGKLRSLGDK